MSAQLCRSLTTTGAWRCETASGTQAPGTLHFYTRVASVRDTVVEHGGIRTTVSISASSSASVRTRPGFAPIAATRLAPTAPDSGKWSCATRMAGCSTKRPSWCSDRIRPASVGPVLLVRVGPVLWTGQCSGVFDANQFRPDHDCWCGFRLLPVCAALVIAVVSAQQNTVVPQPRANALPAPGTASPKPSRPAPKPEGVTPSVPAGFTVTTYAELPSPRMMAYAPNGDLFVSSPGTNTITVLRDANNDGTFEARGTYAQGGAAPPRGGGCRCRGWRRTTRRRTSSRIRPAAIRAWRRRARVYTAARIREA